MASIKKVHLEKHMERASLGKTVMDRVSDQEGCAGR